MTQIVSHMTYIWEILVPSDTDEHLILWFSFIKSSRIELHLLNTLYLVLLGIDKYFVSLFTRLILDSMSLNIEKDKHSQLIVYHMSSYPFVFYIKLLLLKYLPVVPYLSAQNEFYRFISKNNHNQRLYLLVWDMPNHHSKLNVVVYDNQYLIQIL